MALTAGINRDGDIAATGDTLVSIAPATGNVVASYPVDGPDAVAAAVQRARGSAAWWWELGFDGRAACLMRWRAEIARGSEELAELISRENGKTLDSARAELLNCIELIAWAAENAPRVLAARDVPTSFAVSHLDARVEYRPYGVVGVIGPWNFPAATPMGVIVFAMAAGNSVVFKPSELTPAVANWLVDAWRRAVPDRPVFDVVVGFAATGSALVSAGVDKVAFTGSAKTGVAVMRAAAEHLTPMLMELGGNDPAIVAADADLETAAESIVWGAFTNTGLGCISLERAIVVEAVYDEFVRRVAEHAGRLRGFDDADPQVGAIPLAAQIETIRAHVADALERGATAVVGGLDSIKPPFVDPIVLADVPRDALIATEETFGPILAIIRVADDEEAIAVANETVYGLGSSIFSGEHGTAIARRLRAGMTSIQCAAGFAMVSGLPFGGGGGVSGFGRKHGDEGLLEFARPQAIATRARDPQIELATFDLPPGLLQGALARVSAMAIEQAQALES